MINRSLQFDFNDGKKNIYNKWVGKSGIRSV